MIGTAKGSARIGTEPTNLLFYLVHCTSGCHGGFQWDRWAIVAKRVRLLVYFATSDLCPLLHFFAEIFLDCCYLLWCGGRCTTFCCVHGVSVSWIGFKGIRRIEMLAAS